MKRTPKKTSRPRRNAATFDATCYAARIVVPHLVNVLDDPEASPAAVLAAVDPVLTLLGCLRGVAHQASQRRG